MLSLGLALLVAGTTNMPFAAMAETDGALVKPVVERPTLRREYSTRTFRGRREQFEFLMDHIVACSVLSESLGLIGYRAVEEAPGRAFADDRAGARGILQQVYCEEGTRV